MKFTLALLTTAFALVTTAAAGPQGGLPIFVCMFQHIYNTITLAEFHF